MSQPTELESLRREIDKVDLELIGLLGQRFEIVDKVIALKKVYDIPSVVQDRIDQVIANVGQLAEANGIPRRAAESVWRALVAETIAYEELRGLAKQ